MISRRIYENSNLIKVFRVFSFLRQHRCSGINLCSSDFRVFINLTMTGILGNKFKTVFQSLRYLKSHCRVGKCIELHVNGFLRNLRHITVNFQLTLIMIDLILKWSKKYRSSYVARFIWSKKNNGSFVYIMQAFKFLLHLPIFDSIPHCNIFTHFFFTK